MERHNMTKKSQTKKEVATLPLENTVEIKYNTDILLEKILEACREIKLSVDELARKFGGGY
jgi:hypothetical protein